jgi:hypothetical protein
MQEMAHFRLGDWLVPPVVIPALLLLVVIASLYRWLITSRHTAMERLPGAMSRVVVC